MIDDNRKFDAIQHVVHDWSMLVRLRENNHKQPSPLNHATERAVLVECRKFANFFMNKRGPRDEDIICRDFVNKRFKPKLSEWKAWHDHINRQLMHLKLRAG